MSNSGIISNNITLNGTILGRFTPNGLITVIGAGTHPVTGLGGIAISGNGILNHLGAGAFTISGSGSITIIGTSTITLYTTDERSIVIGCNEFPAGYVLDLRFTDIAIDLGHTPVNISQRSPNSCGDSVEDNISISPTSEADSELSVYESEAGLDIEEAQTSDFEAFDDLEDDGPRSPCSPSAFALNYQHRAERRSYLYKLGSGFLKSIPEETEEQD